MSHPSRINLCIIPQNSSLHFRPWLTKSASASRRENAFQSMNQLNWSVRLTEIIKLDLIRLRREKSDFRILEETEWCTLPMGASCEPFQAHINDNASAAAGGWLHATRVSRLELIAAAATTTPRPPAPVLRMEMRLADAHSLTRMQVAALESELFSSHFSLPYGTRHLL